MSISKVFSTASLTVWCADAKSIFRPAPIADTLLEGAPSGAFTLRAGKTGLTAFQIILLSDKDTVVTEVSAPGVTCLSTDGVDVRGDSFHIRAPLYAGEAWPFWCLLDSPAGDSIAVRIRFESGEEVSLPISLDVSEEYNNTFSDGESLVRIAWLNSRAGAGNTVTRGFDPVTLSDRTIRIIGREITVAPSGGIESIGTRFTGNNSSLADTPREILAAPLGYSVFENDSPLEFVPVSLAFSQEGEGCVCWHAVNACGDLLMEVTGSVEFDGALRLSARIKNAGGRAISVRLSGSLRAEFAKYFMGLGMPGCKTPEEYIWFWDEHKRQDSLWCGSVNGGVCIHPTADGLSRPFVNIYFHHSANYMPAAWVNGGKGTFRLNRISGENAVSLRFESGAFTAENDITFSADIWVSPFKRVDMASHWSTHFYHKNYNVPYSPSDVQDALSNHCTHINLHHGNDTLPFLNYPMFDIEPIRELADMAHKSGLGLKPYYTVRELTTRLPELVPFRSLRTEIFPPPTYAQGGVSWQMGVDDFLTENFGDSVIPAWKHTFVGGKFDGTTDPTLITDPEGRISNFYVGSLEWLVKSTGIDGLYIDDTGIDRHIMRRVRRVFDENRPNAKFDFHTCNHFYDSPELGFGFGHNMLVYMQLMPYLDSLWVGEGYDYHNTTPEYLLTEVSGLPFGVMGEMLEGRYDPWRGMLFGMTSRYPYCLPFGGPSPVPVWEMRGEFSHADMLGFWDENNPVCADCDGVPVTSYVCRDSGRMLLCAANFADGEVSFRLRGDALHGKKIFAPSIAGIQDARTLSENQTITLPKNGGIFLIAE